MFKSKTPAPTPQTRLATLAAAAVASFSLFAINPSALAVTISYSGTGLVTGPAQMPPLLVGLTISPETSNYSFGTDSSWTAEKLFTFDVAMLKGGGSFTFSNGASSLFGSFTSARDNSTAPTDLLYTVMGGTGIYAGYGGTGYGVGSTVGNPFSLPGGSVSFHEGGYFNVNLTPVPEPASAVLLALGLAGALVRHRRGAARLRT